MAARPEDDGTNVEMVKWQDHQINLLSDELKRREKEHRSVVLEFELQDMIKAKKLENAEKDKKSVQEAHEGEIKAVIEYAELDYQKDQEALRQQMREISENAEMEKKRDKEAHMQQMKEFLEKADRDKKRLQDTHTQEIREIRENAEKAKKRDQEAHARQMREARDNGQNKAGEAAQGGQYKAMVVAKQRELDKANEELKKYREAQNNSQSLQNQLGLRENEIAGLRTEAQREKQRVQTLTAEKSDLQHQIKLLLDEQKVQNYKGMLADYNKLKLDSRQAGKEHTNLQGAHNKLQIQYNILQTARTDLQNELTALRQNLDQANNDGASLQAEHTALQQRFGEVDNEKTHLQQTVDAMRTAGQQLEADLNQLSSDHGRLTATAQSLQDANIKLESKCESLELGCNDMMVERDAANKRCTELEGLLKEAREAPESPELQAQLSSAQKAHEDLQIKFDKLTETHGKVNDAMQLQAEGYEKQSRDLAIREKEHSELLEEFTTQGNQLKETGQLLKKALEDASSKELHIDEQNGALSRLQEDIATLRNNRSKLEAKVKGLEGQQVHAATENRSSQSKNKKLSDKVGELTKDLSDAKDLVNGLQKQLADLAAEKNTDESLPEKPLEDVSTQWDNLHSQVQPLLEDQGRLRKGLRNLQTKTGAMRTAARKLVDGLLRDPSADHSAAAANFKETFLKEESDSTETSSRQPITRHIVPTDTSSEKDLDTDNESSSESSSMNLSFIAPPPIRSNVQHDHPDRTLREQISSASPSMAADSPSASVQSFGMPDPQEQLEVADSRLRQRVGLPSVPNEIEIELRAKLEKYDILSRRKNGGKGLLRLSNPKKLMWDLESTVDDEQLPQVKAGTSTIDQGTQTSPDEQPTPYKSGTSPMDQGTQTSPDDDQLPQVRAGMVTMDQGNQRSPDDDQLLRSGTGTSTMDQGTQTSPDEQPTPYRNGTSTMDQGTQTSPDDDQLPRSGTGTLTMDQGLQTSPDEQPTQSRNGKSTMDQGTQTDPDDKQFPLPGSGPAFAPAAPQKGNWYIIWLILLAIMLATLCTFWYWNHLSHVRLQNLLSRGDDMTRLALLSVRAGGGTGTAVPTWLWDDELIQVIPGLYG